MHYMEWSDSEFHELVMHGKISLKSWVSYVWTGSYYLCNPWKFCALDSTKQKMRPATPLISQDLAHGRDGAYFRPPTPFP